MSSEKNAPVTPDTAPDLVSDLTPALREQFAQQIEQCMMKDRFRLRQQLQRLANPQHHANRGKGRRASSGSKAGASKTRSAKTGNVSLAQFEQNVQTSIDQVTLRAAATPDLTPKEASR